MEALDFLRKKQMGLEEDNHAIQNEIKQLRYYLLQFEARLEENEAELHLVQKWLQEFGAPLSVTESVTNSPVRTFSSFLQSKSAYGSSREIVEELLASAPNFTLHIDEILSNAKNKGYNFNRQSIQSLLSRSKETFRSVDPGSGKWTLVTPPHGQDDNDLDDESFEQALVESDDWQIMDALSED